MANTVTSGWFTSTIEDALTNITAFDLELDTHKAAIYTTAGTIANTVYDQVAPTFASIAATYGGVEVANSTGWVAPGGELVNTTEVTLSPANSVMFDAADYAEASTTFTNGEFLVMYADALTTPVADQCFIGVLFSAAVSPSAGTLTITWDALGVGTFDCLP